MGSRRGWPRLGTHELLLLLVFPRLSQTPEIVEGCNLGNSCVSSDVLFRSNLNSFRSWSPPNDFFDSSTVTHMKVNPNDTTKQSVE
ncbi:uncharacterized protein LACBIDRAFT_302882 [Laccaria bicolor S238N-H82]|uniref:Predicted protein n=1 Tax=Laccaria bicolor (strain S238N-H82 / ATCC MYA-4686) TaxID=486041 RepID=B0DII8_LACBS|nr:uncharacterized protein LACBIDRAFT_302882 [Laccaria bicolor S238N-H82]EDR05695.1 predicted protein [Laccaria bicolor S238N-H82]|eukprot:XP_001883799.1 predicted protein [Laccaria bicolor S238N-H82]